ncbi:elongation factor G [Nitrospira moscoviensis]|uniref:Elongation factor G n=1 Tax=Nitrospira moscoviensis TaxID=42253 RepID=A0A0K2GC98_NITMO|nr:elongation factor G [Nitrospira moscoviensis]ALA58474.1 Elongation factor G (EF-G) [Nitrospira moscoviensis]
MEAPRVEPVRNVAIVSSAGAGKTSLSEALLYVSGAIPTLGSVPHGTTVSDFEPEELHHHSSASTSLLHYRWGTITINLLDPPGALSLLGEPLAALRAVDAVIIVLNGQAGVRTELARVWARIHALALPCLVFVNGLDREGVSFPEALEVCRKQLDCPPVPMTLPLNPGPGIDAVLDVRRGTLIRSGPASPKADQLPIPPELEGLYRDARKQLIEAVAESDEQLLEAYVGQGDLSHEDLLRGLRADVLTRQFLPVYAGSAIRNVGVWSIADAIETLLPSPEERAAGHPFEGRHPETGEVGVRKGNATEPFSAYVFKTLIDPFVGRLSYCRVVSGTVQADTTVFNATRHVREKLGHFYAVLGKRHTAVSAARAGEIIAIGKLKDTQAGDTLCQESDPICYPGLDLPRPVLSFAIDAKSKAEIDKVSLGLHKLIEEDPTLAFVRNADTKEMVLSGLGQLHIDLALEKLHRKFGADVTLHTPKIPYRETIKTAAQAQGKYKKQTGGHGQYGDCWLELTPLPRGEGFVFESRVVGGAIPRNFIPAIEKGVVEAMHEGVLSGFPVVDVRVAVYDGSYHVVDSSEMSFKIAGSMAFKKAMESAHPVLLEPMMTVEIDVPTDAVGAVMGDLNARRGRILSVRANDHAEQITALVPLAEMLKYAPALNAMTGGRGSYVMDFARYEEVPRELAGKLIEQHKADRQAVAAH